MNVFGFLAVLVASAALVGITALVCGLGVTIHRTYKDVTEQPKQEKNPIGFTQPEEKEKPEPTEKEIEVKSMDAVIKSVNELMGIETETKEDK